MSKTVKFYIPDLGTRIVLAKPWTFELLAHPANRTLGVALGVWNKQWQEPYFLYKERWKRVLDRVKIPAGTEMKITSMYMRPGESKIPRSVSFWIMKGKCPDKTMEKTRFLARIRDTNKIVCNVLEEDVGTSMETVRLVDSRFGMIDAK